MQALTAWMIRVRAAWMRNGVPRPAMSGAALFLTAAVSALSGCDAVPAEEFRQVQRESQAAQEQVRQLETQLAEEQRTVRNLQEQLTTLRGIDPETAEQLPAAQKIQIERMSGGYDTDRKPGDDGIVLYVQPVDSDGDVIKAPGSIKVTLLDLSEPENPRVIAPYNFDAPTTRKMWYGRLMTNHYTVRCPWPPGGPPRIDQVTAVVEFKDLLTGRVLTAQEAFDIALPPEVGATQPN